MSPIAPDIAAHHKGLRFLMKMRSDPLNAFTTLMEENGAYVWFEIQNKKVLLLNDAVGIRHVFQDNFAGYRKARFNDVLKPLLGDGIFLSEKDTWRRQRRESAPVFANGNFPEMTAQMVAAAQAMLARIDRETARGRPVDLNMETMWFTLDVVLRALFHEEKDDIARKVQDALGHLLGEAERRIWAVASLPQSWVLRLPKYRHAMKFLDRVVAELIGARRRNEAYPDDLLSALVGNYGTSAADSRVLRDQVMSFLLAGHETTANGLAWALYEMGRRPDLKQKIFDETDALLGTATPTYDVVKTMAYTRQVFDEALRLYPPVWTMSREALEDDVIPLEDGRGLFVPKDSTIMLCPYAVQRRRQYWPDPEAFDPDRFTMAAIRERPPMAYFPFGGGARLCLGFRFAQIESVVALAMIAQHYDWELVPGQDIRPEPVITLRPSGPIWFRMKRRTVGASLKATAPVASATAGGCPFHAVNRRADT